MPSPFPGMDPYLEHPILWSGVHQGLATYMQAILNAMLPPNYIADVGERLYVVQPRRNIYPDVVTPPVGVQRPFTPTPPGSVATLVTPTVSEAVASDLPWVLTVQSAEIREVFVQILALTGGERVVTVIEVLSPANKTLGSEGRKLYLTKQQEILESQTHLIEMDLLHQGEHTVAAPQESLHVWGTWDYLVSLHRGGQAGQFEVWAITLRQRLPRIRVPLAGDDPDVVLDLQAVFNRCYDEGGYARRLDYRREPPVSLTRADADWVDALLHERGLR